MPLNLPPEATKAEQRYREARSPDEKIAALQEFMSLIPKHKGTDHLRADLRRKLAQLQDASKSKKGVSRHTSAFRIDREGAGQAAVVGLPNTGKSALVRTLTSAEPEVSPSPYSTWEPTPGMMLIDDVQVQLIDTPPLSRDFSEAELFDLIRRADLILLLVDLQTTPLQHLEEGIAILEAQRIVPAHLQGRYSEEEAYRLRFVPFLVVVNKVDDDESDELYEIFCALLEDDWPLVPVSAETGRNLEALKQAVFKALKIIRIYSKKPGEKPDLGAPFVIHEGATLEEFAGSVHRDFYEQLKTARIWGQDVYDGQMVARDHVLHDGDIVELHI
jgi:ribosome-interacting GTPase 1